MSTTPVSAPIWEASPPPLVRLTRHPVKYARIKLELMLDAVVLAHLGVFIVSALYYLLTQTNPTVKHWWDTGVQPAGLRHTIRDVGEGVLASCMAQAIVWNPFKRSHHKTGRLLRRIQERYHVPVTVAAIASAVIVGTVAYLIGDLLLHIWSVHVSHTPPKGSLWNRTIHLWDTDWDRKALGFVAALAARRPLNIVFDGIQNYFASRRAAAGKGLRFYHPPVFQARYNYLLENRQEVREYPWYLTALMSLLLAGGIVLAGYGYYVLTYKA